MAQIFSLSAAFALALAVGTLAQAQPPAQSASAPASDDVIVTGQRTREAVNAFVSHMAVAPRHNNQLARWDHTLCPGLIGLKTRYAQFVLDRIAQRAEGVGLSVGDPGCTANVLIVVTREPDAIAHQIVRQHPDLMGQIQERGHVTLGRAALAAFENSDAPVRWWQVARTITKDGDVIGDPQGARSAMPGDPPGAPGPPVTMLSGGSSRVNATTHQDFGIAVVIVDANQLGGVGFPALADYLAMVTLARLDADADTTAFPTILNLFRPNPTTGAPAAMTDWDVAYLHGLYTATQDARNSNQQNGEIEQTMARALAPGAPDPAVRR